MFNKLLLSALIPVCAIFLLSCANDVSTVPKADDRKTYQIGVITSLTGETVQYGQEQKKILDYHVTQLNKKNNYKIELVYQDGECDVGAASAAMRKLVEESKMQFVLGGLCSAATFAAAPYTKDYQTILLTATTSNQALDGLSPRTFSLSYPEMLVPQATAKELAKYNKVATLSDKADETMLLETDLDNLLFSEYKGVKLVYDEKVERGTVNFDVQIKQIKKSGADVLWLNPSSRETALGMLADIEKNGLKIKLIGQFTFNDPSLLSEASPVVNNMLIIDAPTVSDKKFLAYRDTLMKTNGKLEKINVYYTAATIDALDLLVKLISENNGDFASVEKAINTGTFTGNVGKIYFGGKTFPQSQKVQRLVIRDNQIIQEEIL